MKRPLDSCHEWFKEIQDTGYNSLTHTSGFDEWVSFPYSGSYPKILACLRYSSDGIKVSTVLEYALRIMGKVDTRQGLPQHRVVYCCNEKRATTEPLAKLIKSLVEQILRLHYKDNALDETITGLLQHLPAWTLSDFCSVLLENASVGPLLTLLDVILQTSAFPLIIAMENFSGNEESINFLRRLDKIERRRGHKVICSFDRPPEFSDLQWMYVAPDTEYAGKQQSFKVAVFFYFFFANVNSKGLKY